MRHAHIGADGANSAVRQAMGVQNLAWSYDQMGVVATLELSEETNNITAWQRFLPSGPVALLPLNPSMSSLVWSTSVEHAKQLLAMPEERFVDALNDALWKQYPRSTPVDAAMSWLGDTLRQLGASGGAARQLPPSVRRAQRRAAFPLAFGHSTRYVARGTALIGLLITVAYTGWNFISELPEEVVVVAGDTLRRLGASGGAARQLPPSVRRAQRRAAFPLAFGHSTRYVATGTALIGDAAHRVHPLAGQGVNLGFGDVKHLTEFLGDALYQGLDVAHHSWLEKYESVRQKHNIPTQLAIEAIHRLYSVDLPPFVLVRSLGLTLTNALKPVKTSFGLVENKVVHRFRAFSCIADVSKNNNPYKI
ncbi:unnamed protein product [Plutella xylostella]|uniref:(diamondback moth) hypothetical protein n=1 Tax=Plutella xylostella TaxID=51655 RepID=A0A8S4FZH1_PLUXY|nr:unnamed protein product [Plutella xylostella]